MLPVKKVIFISIILTGMGWTGLVFVILNTLPTLGPRWLFFFFIMLASSGTFMPLVTYLHWRFSGRLKVEGGVILRESMLIGLYFCILAWLQLGKVLSLPLGIFVTLGMGVIEFLLRMSETSKFKPTGNSQ